MKTDRELLELAAKAAGMQYRWDQPRGAKKPLWLCTRLPGDIDAFRVWNPLSDDGQALRLAVKLQLEIVHYGKVVTVRQGSNSVIEHERAGAFSEADIYAATRRAIVRAAAEIGEAL